jgi:hypothetical protein
MATSKAKTISSVEEATKLQEMQGNQDLKNAYIKQRASILASNPSLLGNSIPEYREGMNLQDAFKQMSFIAGGRGRGDTAVPTRRSALDRAAEPGNPLAAMPSREASMAVPYKKGTMSERSKPNRNPFDPNPRTKKGFGDTSTSELDRQEQSAAWMADPKNNKGRTKFEQYQSAPATGGDPGRIKGRVVDGLEGYQSDPEQYSKDSMPGGLFEQMRDAELPAIQKSVFGSPASKDYKATGLDPTDEASGPQAKFGTGTPAVAGKGYYDTPYGRISARKANPGDVFTPADPSKNKDEEEFQSAIKESEDAFKKRGENITDISGAKYMGESDTPMMTMNRDENDPQFGDIGYTMPTTGVQNTRSNPTVEKANQLLVDQTAALRKKYPLIFEKDTAQNKEYVKNFNAANPRYSELNDFDKLSARTEYMKKMEDNPAYAETPPVLPSGAPNPAPSPENSVPFK